VQASIRNILIISLAALYIFGCKHEPVEPPMSGGTGGTGSGNDTTGTGGGMDCDPDSIYFQQTVLPLLISSCAIPGCHDAGTAEDDVILNNYENIINTADVEAFDLDGSDLYEVITENDPDKLMPPPEDYPALSEDEINLIKNWILQGAQNLSCESGCDTTSTNITYIMNIEPIISAKCQGCHSGMEPQGGISFTSYANVRDEALNGLLLDAVQHTGSATPMPYQSDQLPQCEIDLIQNWIDNGAPE
jgi:hypothetical protein